MRITQQQFLLLQDAFLDAFSSKADLESVVRRAQTQSLDQLALGDNLTQIIERLIVIADQHFWLGPLIRAALSVRPNSARLQQVQHIIESLLVLEQQDPFNTLFLRGDQVLVDRHLLRNAMRDLSTNLGKSILLVEGPAVSGKTYSVNFINYLRARQSNFKLASVDLQVLAQRAAEEDAQILPETVGQSIADQFGLEGMPSRRSEQDSRWVGRFCDWLGGKIETDQQICLIVLDHFDKSLLPQGTEDLVRDLAIRAVKHLTKLRLILISYSRDKLPPEVSGAVALELVSNIWQDELSGYFGDLYEQRWQLQGIAYNPTDVAQSVQRVLQRVNPNSPRRVADLGEAVAGEARAFLSQGGNP